MASTETITISKSEYESMKWQISDLARQLAHLKRIIYRAKSEKFIPSDPAQGSLFEVEPVAVEEKTRQQVSYTREVSKEKKQPLRLELPAHLKRVEEVIKPADLPQVAKKIGEVVTEVLEYEPGTCFVRRIIRPKYLISTSD